MADGGAPACIDMVVSAVKSVWEWEAARDIVAHSAAHKAEKRMLTEVLWYLA